MPTIQQLVRKGRVKSSGFGCLSAKKRGLRARLYDDPEKAELSNEEGGAC